MRDQLSLEDLKTLASVTSPMFASRDPFSQLCNALLTATNIFVKMSIKKLREEQNKAAGPRLVIALYLPWILSAVSVYQMWMVGNLHRWSWAVGLCNQLLWSVWITSAEQWGFLPLNVALWIVYARNHALWNRSDS